MCRLLSRSNKIKARYWVDVKEPPALEK